MLLIADSGSTKCDWVLFTTKDSDPIKFRSKGLNPSILKREELTEVIESCQKLIQYKNEIKSIYFFGAGCNTKNTILIIEEILSSFFTNANSTVKEDTMAAIWATTSEPAVVCILGTGSNCCFYDGKNIQHKVPALGYMFMDDGSGNYFGKELLRNYFYNKMPEEIKTSFENDFVLDQNELTEKLYQSKTPNEYLAEFAIFLFKHKEHPFIENIIEEGLTKFIDNNILQFKEELNTVKLHFVGSIAFYAQDYIMSILKKRGISASSFVKRPIENVIQKIKSERFLN